MPGATNLEEIYREDGPVVFVGKLGVALAIAQDLIDANLLIPARDREEVLLVGWVGVEGEV